MFHYLLLFSALQILYHAEDLGVTIFGSGHDHQELLLKKQTHGLNKATKEFINQQVKVVASKTILDLLATEAETNPDIKMPKIL